MSRTIVFFMIFQQIEFADAGEVLLESNEKFSWTWTKMAGEEVA
jgi:hypothetical protein